VAIKATISLTNWQDAESGKTGNPVAEQAILTMAGSEELLVEDGGHAYAPVRRGGAWTLEQVLTEDEVADLLRIPVHEAHRLLLEAAVPVFRTRKRLFSPQQLRSAAELQKKVEEYTASHGLQPREAALELGLTLDSYQPLVNKVLFNSNRRVLKPLLEAYRNKFLPRDKIWGTRTSLIREFVDNFNRENPTSHVVLQPCDVDSCGHAASAQCANSACHAGTSPRFVCPAHEEWVDIGDIRRRPPALCPWCAAKVSSGQLAGFLLL